jgi:hypothetical protein
VEGRRARTELPRRTAVPIAATSSRVTRAAHQNRSADGPIGGGGEYANVAGPTPPLTSRTTGGRRAPNRRRRRQGCAEGPVLPRGEAGAAIGMAVRRLAATRASQQLVQHRLTVPAGDVPSPELAGRRSAGCREAGACDQKARRTPTYGPSASMSGLRARPSRPALEMCSNRNPAIAWLCAPRRCVTPMPPRAR